MKIKMSKVSENPFYGKNNLKNLLDTGKTCTNKSSMFIALQRAWEECKNDKTLREGFFVVCFSIGDITNRQHNIFMGASVDNGGEACRPQMMWILSWMRINTPIQYYKFMFSRIINEFISWFALLACQVRTVKGKKNVNFVDTDTYSAMKEHDLTKLAEYVASRLKTGSIIDKVMLSKWLVKPRLSKRQKIDRNKSKTGQRDLQPITKEHMQVKVNFYKTLSSLMGWEVILHKNNLQFKGLEDFKKEYNTNLESVLFSTKAILKFDREQFFKLLNEVPSGARYRIRRRLLTGENTSKEKWISSSGLDFGKEFLQWEKFKETKQQEQRTLTEKIRQGVATEQDKVTLEKVKKEAKVNTGAETIKDQLEKLMRNDFSDITVQSLLDKINFAVPVLVIADCSGSMGGKPTFIARLLATVAMLKNPSKELDNLLVRFGSNAEFITDGSSGSEQTNRFMVSNSLKVPKLIDRTKSFSWNYNNISKFINSNMGGTYFVRVADELRRWVNSDSILRDYRIEQLQQYSVILVISDGDMNSSYSAASSMQEFMGAMRQIGWEGVVVVWDVKENSGPVQSYFSNIPNCIHYYGYNLGIINQIFTNLHDLDVIDVYSELKSLHKSNRYSPIVSSTI